MTETNIKLSDMKISKVSFNVTVPQFGNVLVEWTRTEITKRKEYQVHVFGISGDNKFFTVTMPPSETNSKRLILKKIREKYIS